MWLSKRWTTLNHLDWNLQLPQENRSKMDKQWAILNPLYRILELAGPAAACRWHSLTKPWSTLDWTRHAVTTDWNNLDQPEACMKRTTHTHACGWACVKMVKPLTILIELCSSRNTTVQKWTRHEQAWICLNENQNEPVQQLHAVEIALTNHDLPWIRWVKQWKLIEPTWTNLKPAWKEPLTHMLVVEHALTNL